MCVCVCVGACACTCTRAAASLLEGRHGRSLVCCFGRRAVEGGLVVLHTYIGGLGGGFWLGALAGSVQTESRRRTGCRLGQGGRFGVRQAGQDRTERISQYAMRARVRLSVVLRSAGVCRSQWAGLGRA